ncbi:MAG: hypothetical protein ABI760_00590 [Ferruginibacter sp.]
MKIICMLLVVFGFPGICHAQTLHCSNPVYRQFDFWVGEWEAYGKNGKKAGDSRISIILDSCIVLEEWTSLAAKGQSPYSGKSFNTYNAATNQWQQTWVDNAGGSNEYLQGKYEHNSIVFITTPFPYSNDTIAIRRLSFFDLNKDKVRQFGEISKDNGTTWVTEYDLEYRRKK